MTTVAAFEDIPRPTGDVEEACGSLRAELGPVRTYPKGVELFAQGRMVEEVSYLVGGWVKLVEVDAEGHELIVHLASAGTWLGSAAAVANLPTPVSAVTCTSARIAAMSTTVFGALLGGDPEFSRQVHQAHAHALCRQMRQMLRLGALSSRQRLQYVIREFIGLDGQRRTKRGIRVTMPLLRRELAQLIAVTPEHLSRLLKDMEIDGLIQRDSGWISVPDIERLQFD